VPVAVSEGDIACGHCGRVAGSCINCISRISRKLYHAVVCRHERENKTHGHP
jgi:hypothetical protein